MNKYIWIPIVYLTVCSISDLRERRISLKASTAAAAAGITVSFLSGRMPGAFVNAVLPGILLIVISKLTRGALGAGDGIAAAVTGCCSDTEVLVEGLFLAFLYAAVFALVMFLRTRKKETAFPFIPFLLAGFLTSALP